MLNRIVVLGGGGVAGIAWETGVITGLARSGADLAQADGFIGTSAGSVVGAQLAGGISCEAMFAAQMTPGSNSQETFRPYSQAAADEQNQKLMLKVGGNLAAARSRIGAFALRSETVPRPVRRAIVAARLPYYAWPQRWLGVVAIDANSAEYELFDRDSKVELIDAVTASCAVPGTWPTVEIAGRHFMDGGIRSMTNADLALGASHVVVLAPLGYSENNPVSGHLRAEVALLQASGCVVDVIVPNDAALQALGDNVLDPSRCIPSANAGLAQGLDLAALLAKCWNLNGRSIS